MVAAAVALGAVLFSLRGSGYQVGDVVDAPLTLTPQDRYNLSCALARPVAGFGCAFPATAEAKPRPLERAAVLAPYVTTDRRLFLVPGLFERPELVQYLESLKRKPRKLRDQRFTARCKLRLLERAGDVSVRFGKRQSWGKPTDVWVAQAESCSIR